MFVLVVYALLWVTYTKLVVHILYVWCGARRANEIRSFNGCVYTPMDITFFLYKIMYKTGQQQRVFYE